MTVTMPWMRRYGLAILLLALLGCSRTSGSDLTPDGGTGLPPDPDAGSGADAGTSPDGGAPDAGHGGFFLRGHVELYGGDPATVSFRVADDLGREVPVFVYDGAPDYRLEVPPLPDFDRLYTLTFSTPGYAPVSMGGIYKPGYSGTVVRDTFDVPPAALNPGTIVGIPRVLGVNPIDGTLVVSGRNHFRLVRRGPSGLEVKELTETGIPQARGNPPEVPFTPDGRFAFVIEAGADGERWCDAIDLTTDRVVLRFPRPMRDAITTRGTRPGSDTTALIPAFRANVAVMHTDIQATLPARILDWTSGTLTEIEAAVEPDGLTPDGTVFVSLSPDTQGVRVRGWTRATNTFTDYGLAEARIGGPPLLAHDASFALIADHTRPVVVQGPCWTMNGCTLKIGRPGGVPERTIATGTLRYTVSTTRHAVMFVTPESVVHYDVDTNTATSTPLARSSYGAYISTGAALVTDDRLTVLDEDGIRTFDVATGAMVAELPGLWRPPLSYDRDTIGLLGACNTLLPNLNCRAALLDTRTGTVTELSMDWKAEGYPYASGARAVGSAVPGSVESFGTATRDRSDALLRWTPFGGQAFGLSFPDVYRAPCIAYVRISQGVLTGHEDETVLCVP